MVLETISVKWEAKRTVLPGSSLSYGQCNVISKTMALLFALWLVAGPWFCDLAWLLDKVHGITTDFGGEIRTIEVPDVLRAFLAWNAGSTLATCQKLVVPARRLFQQALRIGGWSHANGNLMKKVAESYLYWPHMLTKIRNLCAFYRNGTWRKYVARTLKHAGWSAQDLKVLDSFTAELAKWRYESLDTVTDQLVPLRAVSGALRLEMFQNAQDRVTVQSAIADAQDPLFWTFITCTNKELWHGCETFRRWGLTCECPEHIQQRRDGARHISCFYNGRKLRNAWQHSVDEIQASQMRARALPIEEVENSRDMWEAIKRMLEFKASTIKMRNKYLSRVPWAVARADTEAGAQEVLDQVSKKPLEGHDPVTQWFMRTLGGGIEAVARGEPVPDELQRYVDDVNLICLDENAGEGYHRDQSKEHERAPAATITHLKQDVRHDQEMERIERWCSAYGERGRQVVRYEWRNVKRILQTSWSRRWKPKQISWKAFYSRVYHDDDRAEQDWRAIVNPEEPRFPVPTASATTLESLETEYLEHMFQAGGNYGIPRDTVQHTEDGQQTNTVDWNVYNVVATRGVHSRPHLMPTFDSPEDPVLAHRLAVEIQKLSWRVPPGEEPSSSTALAPQMESGLNEVHF